MVKRLIMQITLTPTRATYPTDMIWHKENCDEGIRGSRVIDCDDLEGPFDWEDEDEEDFENKKNINSDKEKQK
jgi:hypothetical protein